MITEDNQHGTKEVIAGTWTDLDLVDNVESVVVATVREDDTVQSNRQPIRRGLALEGLRKMRSRLLHTRISTQDDQARDGDEGQCG